MAQLIQIRRGLKANSSSIVFKAAELFFLTDTGEFGIGDGSTPGGLLFGQVSPIQGGFQPSYTDVASLQSIVTAGGGIATGYVVPGVIAGTAVYYQLKADSSGIHPDDYDGTTNARSWHQIL